MLTQVPEEVRTAWTEEDIINKFQKEVYKMTNDTQTNINWLEEELKKAATPTAQYEKLESLKLEAGKIVKFSIDFSKPFEKWTDPKTGVIKAIIPVTHKEVKKNFWLNTKNPLFRELLERGKKGETTFAVSTNGSQKDTKYSIVEED